MKTMPDEPTPLVQLAADYCRLAAAWAMEGSLRQAVLCYTRAEGCLTAADKARGLDYGPVVLDVKRDLQKVVRRS